MSLDVVHIRMGPKYCFYFEAHEMEIDAKSEQMATSKNDLLGSFQFSKWEHSPKGGEEGGKLWTEFSYWATSPNLVAYLPKIINAVEMG